MLQRLLEKLREIRNALDDDAVFNVVGEVLPAAHVERVLRDYYAGRLGQEDMEDRLLRDVDETALQGHLPDRPGGTGIPASSTWSCWWSAGPRPRSTG